MAVFDLGRLLLVLSEERVEFIIVGGVAAALQGAPVLTQDVDILYRIEDENLERLERALSRLHAVARGDSRNLPFGKSHLLTTGHKLAMTDSRGLKANPVHWQIALEARLGGAPTSPARISPRPPSDRGRSASTEPR